MGLSVGSYMISARRAVRNINPVKLPRLGRHETALPNRLVRSGMHTGLVEGMFAQVFLSVAYGTVITGLALLLGARPFELGLLGALPLVGSLVQIPAAWWIEQRGQRRRIAIIGSLGRLLWLVPVALLFLPLPGGVKLALFLLALACGHLLLGISTNAWLDWMTDLIPQGVRGRYFGARNMLMGGVALIVGLGGASLIDWSKRNSLEAWGYACMLMLAALGGGVASLLLSRQPEPALNRRTTCCFRELIAMHIRHPRFRHFAGTFVIWQVGVGLGAPFFIAYALQSLHFPLRTLALLDATTAVFGLLAQPYWGRLADRLGQRQILRTCMVLVSPLPWFWLLARPDWVWPLFLGNALGGIAWAGVGMTQINRLMEQAPAEGRCGYMAAFSVATGIPFMLASLGAGTLMSFIGVEPLTLLGLTFHPYLCFFVASGLLRFTATCVGWKTV